MPPGNSLLIVLGNQLFAQELIRPHAGAGVFMAEDMGLCTYERHHQQKIVLFLAAMRAYADELATHDIDVHYARLSPKSGKTYEDRLLKAVKQTKATGITYFEIEDKAMERRIEAFAKDHGLERTELASPGFLCSRKQFSEFVGDKESLRMADFYRGQRINLGILVDADGNPDGGQWSFDADNRKKLPKGVTPPPAPDAPHDDNVKEVIELVAATFADHPGQAADFWWPTTRAQALAWLDGFVQDRLTDFGPYEDAMTTRSATLFHSVLSPCINLGLLTPREVVDRALEHADNNPVPMASLEGFVRQVIGWREFVRGVYRHFSERQETQNFWSHERELTPAWTTGETGIEPLDDTIRTAQKLGWTHHIPRLMVAANLMTLCEIRPASAHRWFMEMYVDSSEWVMGPNVYGMGIFSDGGIFATKPYICGSNYLRKMSDYSKGPWCDTVDGLYWRFIDKHRDFFASNPRLALMPRALDRLSDERRERIFAAAEAFLEEHTTPAGDA